MTLAAVGDIHGMKDALLSLLERLQPDLDQGAKLIFLGDYIDKGTDSRGVLNTLIQVRSEYPDALFLRGNHEDMMLDARKGFRPEWGEHGLIIRDEDPIRLWLRNGGAETLTSYGVELMDLDDDELARWAEFIPEEHWTFLESTQMEFICEPYHFVHAGLLPPNVVWRYGGYDPRLWVREEFLTSRHDFAGRIIVFGHTPQESGKPLIQKKRLGMDTGAVYGRALTAALLPPEPPEDLRTLRFISVSCP